MKKFYVFVVVSFCVALCGILTFVFFEFANASTENSFDASNLTFTITGKVVDDSTSNPIDNIYISPWLHTEEGAISTNDVRTDATGNFTITVSGVPTGVMGSIWAYEGNDSGAAIHDKYDTFKLALNEEISSNTDIGTISLHPLKTGYHGKITDSDGVGIENLYVEFLNPFSTISPYACVCAVTDESGNFTIDPNNPKQGEWYKEPGLGVNASYNVVVSDRVPDCPISPYTPAGSSSQSVFSKNLDVVFNMDGSNSHTGTNSLDISMTNAVHVTMYDREQTPQHCAMWKHQVYVNGVSDPNAEGWLGDSHLELPVGASLSIEDNNRLKVTHVFEGATYDEYYMPYLYILDNWEEVGIDTTKVAKNWRLWKNVSSPSLDNVTETYGPGNYLVLDKSYRNVVLDVEFMDAPINPPDDNPTDIIASESLTATDNPQTSDSTIYILAATLLILLLSTLCVICDTGCDTGDRSPCHL